MAANVPCVTGLGSACACPTSPSAHGEENRSDRDLELLRLASEHFRHDITVLWTQSGFFALLQGILLTAFGAAVGPREAGSKDLVGAKELAVALAAVAVVSCAVWLWSGAIRLDLVRRWHRQVLHLDDVVDRHRMYAGIDLPTTGWRAPSAYVLAVPLLGIGAWLLTAVLVLVLAP